MLSNVAERFFLATTFFRRIHIEVYRKSVTETLFLRLRTSGHDVRSHDRLTSSENGALRLDEEGEEFIFYKQLKRKI